MKNYFEILGVKKGASLDDINKAYRQRVKDNHPDHHHTPESEERMKAINEAIEHLRDLEKRQKHERDLERQNPSQAPPNEKNQPKKRQRKTPQQKEEERLKKEREREQKEKERQEKKRQKEEQKEEERQERKRQKEEQKEKERQEKKRQKEQQEKDRKDREEEWELYRRRMAYKERQRQEYQQNQELERQRKEREELERQEREREQREKDRREQEQREKQERELKEQREKKLQEEKESKKRNEQEKYRMNLVLILLIIPGLIFLYLLAISIHLIILADSPNQALNKIPVTALETPVVTASPMVTDDPSKKTVLIVTTKNVSPSLTETPIPIDADKYIQDGENFLENSDYAKAIASFNSAVVTDSSKIYLVNPYITKMKNTADYFSDKGNDCSEAITIYNNILQYTKLDKTTKQEVMQKKLICLQKLGRESEADSLHLQIQREFYPEQYSKFL